MGDTFGDNSGYTDYGGGDYVDYTGVDTGGGDSFAPDYSSLYGGGSGDIPTAEYDPNAPESQLNTPDYQQLPGDDLYSAYYNNALSEGYDPITAANMAQEGVDAFAGNVTTSEQGYQDYTQSWPIEPPQYFPLPPIPTSPAQVPTADYQQSWPITPPPVQPVPPAIQPNLPPACPAGQYHPYPIGNPQQNVCIPFPAQSPPSSAGPGGASGGASSGGASSAPKPQTPQPQQQSSSCPPGQYRSPSTGACKTVPKCTTGYVFDPQREKCVAYGQTATPLCPPGYWPNYNTRTCELTPACSFGTVFNPLTGICAPAAQTPQNQASMGLSGIPWWLWLLLGGALLLSDSNGEQRKTTTVRYQRAKR